jgi:hypothetical protein
MADRGRQVILGAGPVGLLLNARDVDRYQAFPPCLKAAVIGASAASAGLAYGRTRRHSPTRWSGTGPTRAGVPE